MHHIGCEVQLAYKCLFTPTFGRVILTCKVGQTELVFGMRTGLISRSAHEWLHVCVCNGYDLFHPD